MLLLTIIFCYKIIIAVFFACVLIKFSQTGKLGRMTENNPVYRKTHIQSARMTFSLTILAVILTEVLTWINGRHFSTIRTIHLYVFAFPFLITLCMLMGREWFPILGRRVIHLPTAISCFIFCCGMNITGDLLLFFFSPTAHP